MPLHAPRSRPGHTRPRAAPLPLPRPRPSPVCHACTPPTPPPPRGQATPSFDCTWRLWDAEAGACLLEQEGHSRGVYAVAFHPDGSLAGSVGLDAIGGRLPQPLGAHQARTRAVGAAPLVRGALCARCLRFAGGRAPQPWRRRTPAPPSPPWPPRAAPPGRVWDCRTGRSVHVLEGHVKQVLCIDFAPDGYQVGGSEGGEREGEGEGDVRGASCGAIGASAG
jgi:hypothetical protein